MIHWGRAESHFKDLLLRAYNWKADVLMQKSTKMIWYAKETKQTLLQKSWKVKHWLEVWYLKDKDIFVPFASLKRCKKIFQKRIKFDIVCENDI